MMEENQKNSEQQNSGQENRKAESRLQEEIQAGEWQRLSNFETYRTRSRQGKIIATHQALANRIKQLETLFYQLVKNHPQKSVKLLAEIKRLRILLEYLLQALIWEEKGELEEHRSPEELEGMI